MQIMLSEKKKKNGREEAVLSGRGSLHCPFTSETQRLESRKLFGYWAIRKEVEMAVTFCILEMHVYVSLPNPVHKE